MEEEFSQVYQKLIAWADPDPGRFRQGLLALRTAVGGESPDSGGRAELPESDRSAVSPGLVGGESPDSGGRAELPKSDRSAVPPGLAGGAVPPDSGGRPELSGLDGNPLHFSRNYDIPDAEASAGSGETQEGGEHHETQSNH